MVISEVDGGLGMKQPNTFAHGHGHFSHTLTLKRESWEQHGTVSVRQIALSLLLCVSRRAWLIDRK